MANSKIQKALAEFQAMSDPQKALRSPQYKLLKEEVKDFESTDLMVRSLFKYFNETLKEYYKNYKVSPEVLEEKAFWCYKFASFRECPPFDKSVMYRHLFQYHFMNEQKLKAMEYGFKIMELGISLNYEELLRFNRFTIQGDTLTTHLVFYYLSCECYRLKM